MQFSKKSSSEQSLNKEQRAGLRIGVIQARSNSDITEALWNATHHELVDLGVLDHNIEHITVPGALEIPILLQNLAKKQKFNALIALGCFIRGETYHFELVANESASGINRVGLDYGIPIINMILTTETLEQAQARQTEKGKDAAKAAVEMSLHLLDDQKTNTMIGCS